MPNVKLSAQDRTRVSTCGDTPIEALSLARHEGPEVGEGAIGVVRIARPVRLARPGFALRSLEILVFRWRGFYMLQTMFRTDSE